MSSVRISEKHWLNPSLEQCYVCVKDKGLVLMGRLPGDEQAPRNVCLNQEPCDECKKWMAQGVILISVDEARTTDKKNPWRTGGWCVVKDEFIRETITPTALAEDILQKRMAFVPDSAWEKLGLPRGDVPEKKPE